MKTPFLVIVLIVLFLLMADISVQLHPLKISFKNLYFAIGFALIMIGVVFIQYQSFHKGVIDTLDHVEKIIDGIRAKKC